MFHFFITVAALAKVVASELQTEAAVQLRWDFNDCQTSGRLGPTQLACDAAYQGTNLEGKITVNGGIQTWTAPTSGLFLFTARGPSGLELVRGKFGRGAVVSADFRIEKGETFKILVGQQSDYNPQKGTARGPGGSGGTFVTRVDDEFILLVAGGGSSSAGNSPTSLQSHADAASGPTGKSASQTLGSGTGAQGSGGANGGGGQRGIVVADGISSSGGGAGYNGSGQSSYIRPQEMLIVEAPQPAISYTNKGFGRKSPGVGGYLMLQASSTEFIKNNGGFGGGGSGSADSGAGGGGGFSGGGGGSTNGWGGGGGSINNGETPKPFTFQKGRGSVTISFIGHPCCGPFAVYVAMCFVLGILVAALVCFAAYRLVKLCKEYSAENKNNDGTSFMNAKKGFYSVSNKNTDSGLADSAGKEQAVSHNSFSNASDKAGHIPNVYHNPQATRESRGKDVYDQITRDSHDSPRRRRRREYSDSD